MREGKALILATRPWAQERRVTSWFHVVSTGLLLVGAQVVTLLPTALPARIVASVLAGLLLVRMFMMYHDYLHQAILRKSWLARAWFTFYGLYVLAPVNIWKRSHNYHHANNSRLNTSSIGSFPIVTTEQFQSMSASERRIYLFIRHPMTILLGYPFAFIWGMCTLSLVRNPSKHWDSALALAVHFGIGLGVFLVFGWLSFLLAFLMPALISSAIGSYLFYAQHNFPDARFTDKEGWSFAGAAMNSSSFMRGGALMRWFTANIGFHHIHHANSRIPFYRLPEVHEAFPEFREAGETSLRLADVAACLRLKVWDPDLGRMLSGQELNDRMRGLAATG